MSQENIFEKLQNLPLALTNRLRLGMGAINSVIIILYGATLFDNYQNEP